MKYFLVEIVYTSKLDEIERITEEHRRFIKTGYEEGIFLISGPKIPRDGGLVIAKSESEMNLEKFFKNDPYCLNGLAKYIIKEFNPKSNITEINNWLEKE